MRKKLYNQVDSRLLKKRIQTDGTNRSSLSFYQYADIKNLQEFRDYIYEMLSGLDVLGRVYIALEGINAQISVPENNLSAFKSKLNSIDFLNGCRLNFAVDDDGKSFFKLMVKLRDKIVADGLNDENLDLLLKAPHITATKFNHMAESRDTLILDMRNHYEYEVGHFENAVCTQAETFREALISAQDILEQNKGKDVILYCTGGIRCEKASIYFLNKGFKNIYQLEGGIIEYTRKTEENGLINYFQGKNFVFDERLGERISHQIIANCHQCGKPSDEHKNCANDACHLLFIQCEECAARYSHCCSNKCSEFIRLPEEQQKTLRKSIVFNGTGNNKCKLNRTHIEEKLDLGAVKSGTDRRL